MARAPPRLADALRDMARKPPSDEDDISLFPFLSVLACIIGTLTLMIAAMALGEMDNETVVSSEQYDRVQQQLTKVQAEVARLKKKRSPGDYRHQFELARAQSSLSALEEKLATTAKPDETKTGVPVPDIDLAALEKELAALSEQIKKLEELVAQRNRPPEQAEVVIKPGGSGIDIDPRFVECRSDSIVIYSEDEESEPVRISKGQLAGDASFLNLLGQVAESKRASVIFLIRDDGIDTYNVAHRIAQSHYAKNAKLPVLGQGKINLSMFKPQS